MVVTVAVTCYNYGRYISACLGSVLNQTYQDIEVIVVDDGSTDETAAAVAPFLDDPRISYHYTQNSGQARAKNLAIRLSTAPIIAFLDADDEWMPDKLARQLPLFDDPKVGVTFTDHSLIDAEGLPLESSTREGYMAFRRGQVTKWLGFENFVPFSGSAVRRAIIDRHGGFDERLGMGIDWDLWLRLSRVTDFDFIPDALFAYRIGHSQQMSRNRVGRLQASQEIFSQFIADHPEAFAAADLRDIECYNLCLRGEGYRDGNLALSTAHFVKACRLRPFEPRPYRGLVRNALALVGYRRSF